MDTYSQTGQMRPAYAVRESESTLLRSVFGWMFLGLVLTGFVAMYVLNTPAITASLLRPGVLIVLCIVELGLVFWLSARVMKMSAKKATGLFLLYSALNGVTIAPLLSFYAEVETVSTAFFITGTVFGVMALFGYTTKRDLSGMGSFLMMGLIGLIIASIVSIFFYSSMMNFIINVVGVLIFTGLTAWDVQKIKKLGSTMDVYSSGETQMRRVAILGALSLYLDFINMFIFILRLLGSRD